MRNRLSFSVLSLLLFTSSLVAIPDEGMWIPMLIEKYNIRLMQEKGFKLSAEDIYSVNKACMKDAVVRFGGGCTGELISPDGLLITNHHCGYEYIRTHSSLEHDYLTNGFWAMSRKEELPDPGLTVTILRRMEDVTARVMAGINDGIDPADREKMIGKNIEDIQNKAVEGTSYRAIIRPFYMGNQYFLFVNEVFSDVRLVGAPPSAIGKFGGETDNWIWPRHTGDFSLFRVYADRNNQPASYSPDNIPYKPRYHFPVSLKGVKEGDFTMVFGYPGATYEYMPSYYIEMYKDHIYPEMISVRTKKIEIMESAINSDPLLRLKYSSKKSGLANSWKKWQGEILGLERMKTISKKEEFEQRLTAWIQADESRKAAYGKILPAYKELYARLTDYALANSFISEVANGIEAVALAGDTRELADLLERNTDPEIVQTTRENLISEAGSFFKDYDQATDRKLFIALMETYGEALGNKWLTPEYVKLKNSCGGDFTKLADKIYNRSVFTDEARYKSFIARSGKSAVAKIQRDPFYSLASGFREFISSAVRPEINRIGAEIQQLNKEYMLAQMEFDRERVFYPDANSTLRVSYGTVKGYYPRDAVYFMPGSTLKGIIEKDNPEIYDYDVPERLRELWKNHDFGRYAVDGEVPVCFIADNHTTGGNSGSPVINGEGHLIGVNFDRDWEGVASDMAFSPDLSRNISLDIRYALFIIDKFAGAGYLLDEMTIIE